MQKLNPEGKSWLDRVALLTRLQRDWREERISRNLDVRDLGLAVTPKFEFIAVVREGTLQQSPERRAFEEEMDREFPSYNSAPEHEDESGPASAPALPVKAKSPKGSKKHNVEVAE